MAHDDAPDDAPDDEQDDGERARKPRPPGGAGDTPQDETMPPVDDTPGPKGGA